MIDYETHRPDHLLSNDLMRRIVLETNEHAFEGRVRRGGVQEHDRRYVSVSRHPEGYRSDPSYQLLKIRPRDLNPLIEILTQLRDALAEDDLRTPDCVYCGEGLADADEAEQHFEERHEDRSPPSEYQREWYVPDPNGELAAAVEEVM